MKGKTEQGDYINKHDFFNQGSDKNRKNVPQKLLYPLQDDKNLFQRVQILNNEKISMLADSFIYISRKNVLDNVYKLALALYAEDKIQDSMELLIESIKIDKTWNDGAAQKQLLEMFSALGFDNSDVIKYRKKLSSILFS